jgi:hypothetical protein
VHSSALFYATGMQGRYPVTHINSLNELDFTVGKEQVSEFPPNKEVG